MSQAPAPHLSASHHAGATRVELEEHANFLRSLARRLVRDDSTADDLAQETLIAAVTSTTRQADLGSAAARPWLVRVLRRKAANEGRSNSRRWARESAGARHEATDSAFDSVAQIDLAERLLGHVRALDPPLRDAIIGRFYRGLSLVELAEEMGVPVTTLQSRITKGLTEIRRRLDEREAGGRSAWLGALAAFAEPGEGAGSALVTTSTAVGGRAASLWISGALIGAVAVVGGINLWGAPRAAEPSSGPGTSGLSKHLGDLAEQATSEDALPNVTATNTDDNSRVELLATGAGADGEANQGSRGIVYYLDAEGQERPAPDVTVEWEASTQGEMVDSLRSIGYIEAGSSGTLRSSSELPVAAPKSSTTTDSEGAFEFGLVPADSPLTIKVPGDDEFRSTEWKGTGADWASADAPIALTRVPHGTLRGQVVDYARQPLAKVRITLDGHDVVTDDEGAFELVNFDANPGKAVFLSAIDLPGHVVVGHEEIRARESGGWEPLTLVLAQTGTLQIKLPPSPSEPPLAVLSVSRMDPLQIRPSHQRIRLTAEIGADGLAEFRDVPVGPALSVEAGRGSPAYDYHRNGVGLTSLKLGMEDVPVDWARIRVPASGFLALELPDETRTQLDVATQLPDGAPAVGARVLIGLGWQGDQRRGSLLAGGVADDQGNCRFSVRAPSESSPLVIFATGPAGASTEETELTGLAIWNPKDSPSQSVSVQLGPLQTASGQIVFPTSETGVDFKATDLAVTLLAPRGADRAPFSMWKQSVSADSIDATGKFEFYFALAGRYRIEARHERFAPVSFEVDLEADTPPIDVRFDALSATAQVTINVELPDSGDGWSRMSYGPSQHSGQSLHLGSGSTSKTISVPPGRHWIEVSGMSSGRKLISRASGFHTVEEGASEITFELFPEIVVSGILADAGDQHGETYLHVISDGKEEPLFAGEIASNVETPWILVDPHGRFRFECTAGDYTALIGTRDELLRGQPRRRAPFTVTPLGLEGGAL